MAEKLIAVPESNLIEIGDAIRLKRDLTTPIPVADMPMQIGLIESVSKPEWDYEFAFHMSSDYVGSTTTGNFSSSMAECNQAKKLFDDVFEKFSDEYNSLRFACYGEVESDVNPDTVTDGKYFKRSSFIQTVNKGNFVSIYSNNRLIELTDGTYTHDSTAGRYTVLTGSSGLLVPQTRIDNAKAGTFMYRVKYLRPI